MTSRQLTSYHDHRKQLVDWMLDQGKDPDRGRGYAHTTAHANAWLLHLNDPQFWLYAAVDSDTSEFLHVRLYPT